MNLENFFSDLLKGTRFERNYDNLSENAEKADALATNVETAFDGLMGFLESAQESVSEFVDNLRTAADQLRAEAQTKTEGVYDSVRPQNNADGPLSPEEKKRKIDYIKSSLRQAGITTSSRWFDDTYTNFVSDKIINTTYRIFGGK